MTEDPLRIVGKPPDSPAWNWVIRVSLLALGMSTSLALGNTPFFTNEYDDIVGFGKEVTGFEWDDLWRVFAAGSPRMTNWRYRPVPDLFVIVMHMSVGAVPIYFRIFYGLVLGTFLNAVYVVGRRLGGSSRVALATAVVSGFLGPVLWETWFYSGSELVAATFLYIALGTLARTETRSRRWPQWILFSLAFGLAVFSKETVRAYGLPVVAAFLWAHRMRLRSIGGVLAPSLLLTGLSVWLSNRNTPPHWSWIAKFMPGEEGFWTSAQSQLLSLAAQWTTPLGVDFFLLLAVGTSVLSLSSARSTTARRWVLLVGIMLFIAHLGAPVLEPVVYFQAYYYSKPCYTFLLLGPAYFLLGSTAAFFRPAPGTRLAAATAWIVLAILAGSVILFPFGKTDPSTRALLPVLPLIALLGIRGGAALLSTQTDAVSKYAGLLLSVLVCLSTGYHLVAGTINLASETIARGEVDHGMRKHLAGMDLEGTSVIDPDPLFPLTARFFAVFSEQPPRRVFDSPSWQEVLVAVREGRLGNRKVLLSHWETKPDPGGKNPSAFCLDLSWMDEHHDLIGKWKVERLASASCPKDSDFVLLDRFGSLVRQEKSSFIHLPLFANDIPRRTQQGVSLLLRFTLDRRTYSF
ncbi:MAG: glycosyltransferase family 39 protein [Nitrospirae bacterium]|nr:glycosyltransferase family 39 protein [Nitrospirota bacterium]